MDGAGFTFRVLGPLEVERNGQAIDAGPPRQRALLTLLLTAPNRVVPTDRISDLLWHGEPSDQVSASIQAYISRLRRALEPARSPRSPSAVLVTRAPGYVVSVDLDTFDATCFEADLERAQSLLSTDPAAALAAAEAARGRWRGAPYADLAALGVRLAEAARLDDLRLAADEVRVEALLATDRPADAAAAASLVLDEQPLRDHTRRLGMLGLYRSGRHAEALRLADDGRRTMRELGLSPSPELNELEQAILDHDPLLLPPAAAAARGPIARPAPGATAAGRPGTRFVGRAAELAALRAALDTVASAGHAVVVLEGEAGIGKTRLATEIAEEARTRHNAVVAWGHGQDVAVSAPFWPIVELLRDLDGDAAVPPAARPTARSELAVLLGTGTAPDDELGRELARTRLLDAVVGLLAGLPSTVGRPVVLVIDDLHWVDPDSFAVLGALARRQPASLLLLTTTRATDPAATEVAAAALLRSPQAHHLPLGPVGVDVVEELAGALLDAPPDRALAELVHQRTEGNAFFAVELLRLLRSEGHTSRAGADGIVPPVVQHVVHQRLQRLPEACRQLLTVAATQGAAFDADVVGQVAGFDEDQTLDLLDIALTADLVRDDGDRWRFTHALVADSLRLEITSTRRSRLHARIADTLARRAGPSQVFDVANHRVGAVDVTGAEPAIRALGIAAEAAVRACAIDVALNLFEQQLDLLARLPSTPARHDEEGRVLLRLVELGTGRVEMAQVRLWLERAGKVSVLGADWARAEGRILHNDALIATVVGDVDRAYELGRALLATAEEAGDLPMRALAHHELALHSLNLGRVDDVGPHLDAADAWDRDPHGQVFDDDSAHGERMVFRACLRALWKFLRDEGTERPFAELWAQHGHPLARTYIGLFAAQVHQLLDDAPGAELWARRSLDAAAATNLHVFEVTLDVGVGWAEAARRPPDPAGLPGVVERLTGRGSEAFDAGMIDRYSYLLAADLALRASLPAEALVLLDAGLEGRGARYFDAEHHRLAAIALRLLRRADEADDRTAIGLELAERQGARRFARRLRDGGL